MKWKSKLFAQSGFTLVEVLIAAAALGGLALVATQLSSDVDKTKKHFEVTTEITSIKTRIASLLYSSESCKNTFLGRSLATVPVSISAIRNAQNSPIYSLNDEFYNKKIKITRMDITARTLTTVGSGKTGTFTLQVDFEKVTSATLEAKIGKQFKGAKTESEEIIVSVTTDLSDQITNCYNDLLSAEETLCVSIGGTFTATPTKYCTLPAYPTIGTVNTNDTSTPAERRVVSERYLAQFLDDLDRRYVNVNNGGGGAATETLLDSSPAGQLTIGSNASTHQVNFLSNVSVGTVVATPSAKLHVALGGTYGNVYFGSPVVDMTYDGGGDSIFIFKNSGAAGGATIFESSFANIFILQNNGNVGIGVSPGSYRLNVNGNGHYNGYVISTTGFEVSSDAKLKKNIKTVESPVEKILGLRGVTFLWDKEKYPDRNVDDRKVYGFVAQEVEKVVPELVRTDKEGYKSVQYQNITSILVEAFKDAWAKIKDMANKIADLDDKTDKLAKENSKLEKRIKELESNHRALAEENKAIKELVCSSADAKTKKLKICK